jgi:hypothetical protein
MIDCMLAGGSVADCAAQHGANMLDEQTKKVIEQLKQLKADTEQALDQQQGSVRNIILIAEGIENGDYDKILLGGGPELTKIVLTIIIDVLVPPVAPIAGPVVAAMVDLYVDLARKVVKALAEGDFSELPEILFQFYFTEMIARPCALLPEGSFKDAVCGNLAKVIGAAAGLVGDAVDFLLEVAEKILKEVGLYQIGDAILGFVGDVWDELFGDGKEDPKVCGPANDYYVKNYLPCLGATAGASAATSPMSGLHSACVAHFGRCYENAEAICNAFDTALSNQANQVNAALEEGARGYTPAIGAFIYSRRAELCTHGSENSVKNFQSEIEKFKSQCTNALSKNVPLQVNACMHTPPLITRPPGPALACSKAVENSNWKKLVADTCEAWCREKKENCAPPPPPCWDHNAKVVESHGFTYAFSPLKRQLCWLEHAKFSDRWEKFINPPFVLELDRFSPSINENRWASTVLASPIVKSPSWLGTSNTALNNALPSGLTVGNCTTSSALLSPSAEWSRVEGAGALSSGGQPSAASPASRDAQSSVVSLLVKPTVPAAEKFELTFKSVALVTGGFESCGGVGAAAARPSSGTSSSRSNLAVGNQRGGAGGAAAPATPSTSRGTSNVLSPGLLESDSNLAPQRPAATGTRRSAPSASPTPSPFTDSLQLR